MTRMLKKIITDLSLRISYKEGLIHTSIRSRTIFLLTFLSKRERKKIVKMGLALRFRKKNNMM